MEQGLTIILLTAASIGFLHTILGPDHYLPFIVMAKARGWSMFKTTWVTALCGLGHVGSSIVLGAIGIIFGIGVSRLEIFDTVRGDLAAWAFILFGLAYFVWGIRRAILNKPHKHVHSHLDGINHDHEHKHDTDHAHVHDEGKKANLTPWVLFIIFVLGPCEPLIPVLMYPASQSSTMGVVLVSIVFATVTIATMLTVVLTATYGFKMLRFGKLEKYTHAIAGATICLSGLAIVFLGL